jgi:hypothetical protein
MQRKVVFHSFNHRIPGKKREKEIARFLHEIPLSRKNVQGCLKLVNLHIWFIANLVKSSYE